MKHKTIYLILTSLSISSAFADKTAIQEQKDRLEKQNRIYLAKHGINIPLYSEINIVPSQKYTNKSTMNNSDDYIFAKQLRKHLAMNEEQKTNGYIKTEEMRAKELIDFKQLAFYQLQNTQNNASPENTHLKESIDDIKAAFKFKGVPSSEISKIIGYAPYGAYKKTQNGDLGDGWDGVIQFFEKDAIGTCAYSEHNRKLAGVGMELIQELVSYEINKKPTILLVQGSDHSGYLYKIEWYDSILSRTLECANKQYSKDLTNAVINLARSIDSSANA